MRTRGKKYQAARQQVPARPHKIEEAVPLIQKVNYTKFDETVEIAVRLGVDPKHSDQMVRGTVVLPHGLGTTKKVLVIAGTDKVYAATEELGNENRAPHPYLRPAYDSQREPAVKEVRDVLRANIEGAI